MDRRLLQLYDFIPKDGKGIVDVGTDHGLIPIRLALSGFGGRIFASDLVPGPLNTAIKAAETCGVENRIVFLLCDGLDLCPPKEIDCILIAGMGGDTICGILDRAEWLFASPYRLILQPMTKAEVVRYWLTHNEYMIDREAVISEDRHIYQIFSAVPGKSNRFMDAEYLVGSIAADRTGDPWTLLIEHQLQQTEKKLAGLDASGEIDCPAYQFYTSIRDQLKQLNSNVTE